MLIKSPHATSFLMAIVIFALYVNFKDGYSRYLYDLDLDLYNEPMSNLNMPIKSPYVTSYSMTTITLALVIQLKCAWCWPCPLECAKVKYKYVNQKLICDFIPIVMLALSFSVCTIFSRNVQWTWPLDKNWEKLAHLHERLKTMTCHMSFHHS